MEICFYIMIGSMVLLGLFSAWFNFITFFPKEKPMYNKYISKSYGDDYKKKYPGINNILYSELYDKWINK